MQAEANSENRLLSSSIPYIGSTLEIISAHDAVRYVGEVSKIGKRSLTLAKVIHYGSEDRQVQGLLPKEPKGHLQPPQDTRTFYDQYIGEYRVLAQPAVSSRGGSRSNSRMSINEDGSSSSPSLHLSASLASLSMGELNSNDNTNAAFYAERDDSDPVYVSLDNSFSSEIESIIASYTTRMLGSVGEHRPSGDTPSPPSTPTPPSSQEHWDPIPAPQRECTYEVYNYTGGPLYYIAQIQYTQERGVGVLVNSHLFPEAPCYVGFLKKFCERKSGRPLLLTQLWEAKRPKITELTGSLPFKNLIYMPDPEDQGEKEFYQKNQGTPWMTNTNLNMQAEARYDWMELVQDAELKEIDGMVEKVLKGGSKRHVVVRANGCVDDIRLSSLQYRVVGGNFNALARGSPLRLQAVRLPVNCWVGPKFVLPNIEYFEDKPPFTPREHEKFSLLRSQAGDHFPVRIIG